MKNWRRFVSIVWRRHLYIGPALIQPLLMRISKQEICSRFLRHATLWLLNLRQSCIRSKLGLFIQNLRRKIASSCHANSSSGLPLLKVQSSFTHQLVTKWCFWVTSLHIITISDSLAPLRNRCRVNLIIIDNSHLLPPLLSSLRKKVLLLLLVIVILNKSSIFCPQYWRLIICLCVNLVSHKSIYFFCCVWIQINSCLLNWLKSILSDFTFLRLSCRRLLNCRFLCRFFSFYAWTNTRAASLLSVSSHFVLRTKNTICL